MPCKNIRLHDGENHARGDGGGAMDCPNKGEEIAK